MEEYNLERQGETLELTVDTEDVDLDSQAVRVITRLAKDGALLACQGDPLARISPVGVEASGYSFDPGRLSDYLVLSMSSWLKHDYPYLDESAQRLSELLVEEGRRRGWPDGWVDDPSVLRVDPALHLARKDDEGEP